MEQKLYDYIRGRLMKRAYFYCKHPTTREEYVDDALYIMARSYNGPMRSDDIIPWCLKVIYYSVMNKSRKEKLFDRAMLQLQADRAKRLTSPAEIDELSPKMSKALQKLPVGQRHALALYAEEYTYNEIASILNVPVGTVMSRLFRARATVKRELEAA